MNADLVLKNGKVITVDEKFSISEAIAVKDGIIIAVGTNDEISEFEREGTNVLDLKGQTVLPGINDTHLHSVGFGTTRPPLTIDLTFPRITSIKDIAQAVREKVAATESGKWIQGNGWDLGSLEECKNNPDRYPSRWDIDAVSSDNPVILTDFSHHTHLFNSKALSIGGVDKNTPDPEGGKIMKDPVTGEPTGIFIEVIPDSVSNIIPGWKRDEVKRAIKETIKTLHSLGVTSFTDGALGPGGDQAGDGTMASDAIDIYREMALSGDLKARVSILLLFGEYGALSLKDIKSGISSYKIPANLDRKWLQIPGIKIFADGIPPNKTAWMNDPYPDGSHGMLVIAGENNEARVWELEKMIGFIHEAGFQIGVHVTGDRAIDLTTKAFVKAIRRVPGKDLRHYLIHGDFISAENIDQLAEYNCGMTVQTGIKALTSDFLPQLVGEKNTSRQFPARSLLTRGVNLTGSSDAPVSYPSWLAGVQAAVTRKSAQTGTVWGAEECISVEDAIRMYTINGAWQDHMEDLKGSIEMGKLADFCILDRDLLSVDHDKIRDISVTMTIVDGEIVYERTAKQSA